MARKLFLPLASAAGAQRPTVDAVRRRLGGRASTEAGAGSVVLFRGDRGGEQAGVVLFVRGEDLDVWVEGDRVRRLRRSETKPAGDDLPDVLAAVAGDARGFARLAEGQRVRFQHGAGLGEAPREGLGDGTLVEKCRFGGLVERADGTVLGVGFRRLWAAVETETN